eukprot:2092300-Amphidinium_carterae.1
MHVGGAIVLEGDKDLETTKHAVLKERVENTKPATCDWKAASQRKLCCIQFCCVAFSTGVCQRVFSAGT